MRCGGVHSVCHVTVVGDDVARELALQLTITMETDHHSSEDVWEGVTVWWEEGGFCMYACMCVLCVCVCVCCVRVCVCVCVCMCVCGCVCVHA